jgi:branched-chain amino acid transport system substrate-binding protein
MTGEVRRPDAARLTRRSVLATGLLGGLAAVTASCSNQLAAAAPALPRGEDLTVGACLDLTGPGKVAGAAAQRGLQVALDRINQSGVTVGATVHQIRLVTRDTASDPATATTMAKDLVEGDQVIGLITAGATATANAIAAVAEQASVPLLAANAYDGLVRPVVQRRFVFKLQPNASDVAEILMDSVVAAGAHKIAVLATADDYGDGGLAALTTATATANITLARTARLPLGVNDYNDPARQVLAAHPDAVVVWGVAPAAGLAARALSGLSYPGLVLFDPGAASEDTMSQQNRADTLNLKCRVVSPFILTGPPPAVTTPAAIAQRDYFDQYTRLFGAFSCLSVYAADALNLLVGGARRAGSSNHLKIRNGLESIPFDGLAGSYKFSTIDHGGVQADSLRVFTIDNTGWVLTD